LEELAKRVAGITGKKNPLLNNKVIFTFAGDHGVADEGVSAFPKEVTAQMVANFLNGGAAVNVLAEHVGARVVIADLGIAKDIDPAPGLIINKVNYGTDNMAKGPAMTREEAVNSIEYGIDIFEKEFEKGIDIIGTGDMGIANTTSASAVTSVFSGQKIEAVTGNGTGINYVSWKNKVKVIKQALSINRPDPDDPIDVLCKAGGFEIGGICGVILAAAARKVPVVIDGFISGAAALIAYRLEKRVKDYMFAAHSSVEKGHKVILAELGLTPLLKFRMRLGEGTGAALGISLVDAAAKIMTRMATFETAGVSEKS
ncbi:MAG: nicotinate-nucleotide--dimethylbenzimidazole phosphoribosyltransferase, partial [bacterium]|nr:nicotinate-nucleotide--dimethylbenzimidazole phosphoribosyltransferase [bacterium]